MSTGIEQQVETALNPLRVECEQVKSERDKAIVELQEAHEHLERMHRSKKELIAVLAQEFRSALTTIQGASELLCQRDLSVADMKEFAADIHQDAQHLARLVTNMLASEQMETERIQLHCEWLDLHALIQEVVERIQHTTEMHTISVKLAQAMPLVRGDSGKLAQVLEKLLHNAIKYSPDGGDVFVSSAVRRGVVHICVQDNGIGIPADAINRIFERYERVESYVNKSTPSSGLGLSQVRQIVQAHGGQVWAESILGEGSRFHVSVPFVGKYL